MCLKYNSLFILYLFIPGSRPSACEGQGHYLDTHTGHIELYGKRSAHSSLLPEQRFQEA